MPDVAVHAAFGREVRERLPKEVGDRIREAPYAFALFGPDVWFMYQPWKKHREGRGRRMHTTRTGEFLTALARQAKKSASPEDLFSYLAGFLCHYALDAETHPYIISMTEKRFPFPRAHMSFEHTLDVREMERAGVWGEKHPVTGHYFPRLRLPGSIREDLNAVYLEVYGWKNCWKALNHSAARYRLCYRVLENPRGLAARLARKTGHPLLKSFAYSESHFREADVENTERKEWAHSHDSTILSRESFEDLRGTALRKAAELIESAYQHVFLSAISEEELARRIGSRSYLSGLPTDDPRNMRVPSMLPPEKKGKERH